MILDRIAQLKKDFSEQDNWEDRYRLIIQTGKKVDGLTEDDQCEKYRIKGCQSQVWLKAFLKDGIVHFQADSDALLVKGIVALLTQVYDGHSPEEIINTPARFLEEIGITEHLSMNRTNGLASMVKQIHLYATMFNVLISKGVMNANP